MYFGCPNANIKTPIKTLIEFNLQIRECLRFYMKNFLIDIIYLIFVVIIVFIVTKTNYLGLVNSNINVDKFYTDIIIIPICAILIRTIIKKMW